MTLTEEEIKARRARFSPKVGDRVTYIIPERGGWSHGFGDVVKLNRVSVQVVDRKFDGETIHVVDRALLTNVIPPSELIQLDVVKDDEDSDITSLSGLDRD